MSRWHQDNRSRPELRCFYLRSWLHQKAEVRQYPWKEDRSQVPTAAMQQRKTPQYKMEHQSNNYRQNRMHYLSDDSMCHYWHLNKPILGVVPHHLALHNNACPISVDRTTYPVRCKQEFHCMYLSFRYIRRNNIHHCSYNLHHPAYNKDLPWERGGKDGCHPNKRLLPIHNISFVHHTVWADFL